MGYNKKIFKAFLKENLSPDKYEKMDFEAYCDDLEEQHEITGTREYELRKFESRDGNPHLFRY